MTGAGPSPWAGRCGTATSWPGWCWPTPRCTMTRRRAPPALIRLARSRPLRDLVCVRTPAFVRTAAALSRPAAAGGRPRASGAAVPDPRSRAAVGDFVADIPLEPDHPSRAPLAAVAAGLAELRNVPALLLWGARDPVFTERYLADLTDRLPHADVQRYAAGRAPGHRGRSRDRRADLATGWPTAARSRRRPRQRASSGAASPWAAQQARAGDSEAASGERRGGCAPAVASPGSRDGSPCRRRAAGRRRTPGRPRRPAGPARASTSRSRCTPAGGRGR